MVVYWAVADLELATGYTIATKKTAQAVAVVAMKMTRVTTGERLPGAHPTSKHMYRDLKNKQWLTCP
jgi:hypothetical protein